MPGSPLALTSSFDPATLHHPSQQIPSFILSTLGQRSEFRGSRASFAQELGENLQLRKGQGSVLSLLLQYPFRHREICGSAWKDRDDCLASGPAVVRGRAPNS